MTFNFRPAISIDDKFGVFVALTGGTNSGKTYSALRLARGLAGDRRIAVLDTEGGRTLHLKHDFDFDAVMMAPPFRPARFAEAAIAAEDAGYGALVIDSFSMEWVGLGGVLDWHESELQRIAGSDMAKRDRNKFVAWIAPKSDHKAMVYSLLQRRIPIIFVVRGEEAVKPGGGGQKPQKLFKWICDKRFPFEVTVSFQLEADNKGVIDLRDQRTFKMEGAHRAIFRHGETLNEAHGEALAAWAAGEAVAHDSGSSGRAGAGKTSFWERDSYGIPVKPMQGGEGSDWARWDRLLRDGIDRAPDLVALEKLREDNSAALAGYARANGFAHGTLDRHYDERRIALAPSDDDGRPAFETDDDPDENPFGAPFRDEPDEDEQVLGGAPPEAA